MDFYVKDGVIIKTAEEEKTKKKKGDGINAAIGLLQELRNFQEKVDACIESQDIAENKSKIEKYSQSLQELYKALIEIASNGVRAMGVKEEAPAPATQLETKAPAIPSTPALQSSSKIG